MTQNIEAAMSNAFVDRTCRVIWREFDWVFSFDQDRAIVLTTPWRIVVKGRIVFTGADHGQTFGHAESIDGADAANRVLATKSVRTIVVHPQLSDMSLAFENDVAVEVFNDSSAYEAWQADFPAVDGHQTVIGMGGGGLSTYLR